MSEAAKFRLEEINCPVCDANEPKFVGWRGGEAHQSGAGLKTSIVRCSICSHQYPNPMPFPVGDLSEIYVDADEYFHGDDVEQRKQNALDLMRTFEEKLGKKGRFLDVGCGAGELLWAADKAGWETEGIDPSTDFIEIGRQRLGVDGRVMTLEEANFPDSYFDAVVLGGIIEHLYDPLGTLREVWRVLRPSGWLYFDAPNEDGLYMRAGNLYMRLRGRDWVVVMAPTFSPFHVQGFNPRSLRVISERANFKVRSLEIAGGVWEQRGESSMRKKIEFAGAKLINMLGKGLNMGSYMYIWAQKDVV